MEPVQSESRKVMEISAENKELSFKLDEPVTTVLNSSFLNDVNGSEDESLSFIVLGKDSVDAQASLLASYVDIQQKSMSIDYKSMVSSLNVTEMQQRLVDVLQENVKLKETLRQNNESMKHQFTTLAAWQEAVTKVHQNHKQKFAETKELINHLKEENAELKAKLWMFHHTEDTGFETINASSESTINISNQAELEQNIPKLTDAISKMNMEKYKEYIASVISEKFTDKDLQQPSKVEKDLESAMKSLNYSDSYSFEECVKTVESLKFSEVCSAKDQEIASLKESIALLKQKLQFVLNPIRSQDLSETSNLNRQKFMQNIKQYNDMLQELTECFIIQVGRFATIEKSLKEITDILKLDDNSNIQCQEKLSQCCKQLADEQVQIITDRQTLIKSQNQFQKIFSDYNSILYEMEIILDENTKLNLQTSEQLEQIKSDRQLLEEERKILDQEKNDLKKEKESFENQKSSLDVERVSLQEEKKLVEQEKITLKEEKISLDHQSKLYENCEKDLQNEKKTLQVRYEQLTGETNGLRQEIEEKNTELQKLMKQLSQSAEQIELLKSQLTVYEEDFQQEKGVKEVLLEEKINLSTELEKQIRLNRELQELNDVVIVHNKNSSINSEQASEHSNDSMRICPKCLMAFQNLSDLMKHVETCIN
ncbi:optineurin isoform X2 [Monomorium pharaonis]|uniref:optineurin isoform X2 n=1 Tax=Monomorium pharaonis TaxID=307658 RepID=UPI00063EF2E1|nr:optineurin isoform X2 [Monomorium pharaonis]